jgi:hypothetical protein
MGIMIDARPETRVFRVREFIEHAAAVVDELQQVLTEQAVIAVRDLIERNEVAVYAMYCMGSCHGDWAPVVDAEYLKVMTDDEAYQWRRDQWLDDKRKDDEIAEGLSVLNTDTGTVLQFKAGNIPPG